MPTEAAPRADRPCHPAALECVRPARRGRERGEKAARSATARAGARARADCSRPEPAADLRCEARENQDCGSQSADRTLDVRSIARSALANPRRRRVAMSQRDRDRVRRLEKERNEARARFEEAKRRNEEGPGLSLRSFGVASSEVRRARRDADDKAAAGEWYCNRGRPASVASPRLALRRPERCFAPLPPPPFTLTFSLSSPLPPLFTSPRWKGRRGAVSR